MVEKIVSEDGTIMVFQNGIHTGVLRDVNYEQYVAMAQGRLVIELQAEKMLLEMNGYIRRS